MSQRPAFRAATDRLIAEDIPLRDVAKLFGVTPGTITRWRSLSPKERLTPPATWRASLAAFARDAVGSMADRGDKLEALAAELESQPPTRTPATTFREATSLLMEHLVTIPEIAEAMGYQAQTVRQMRMQGGTGSRTPPSEDTWAPALAGIAERRNLPELAQRFRQEIPS